MNENLKKIKDVIVMIDKLTYSLYDPLREMSGKISETELDVLYNLVETSSNKLWSFAEEVESTTPGNDVSILDIHAIDAEFRKMNTAPRDIDIKQNEKLYGWNMDDLSNEPYQPTRATNHSGIQRWDAAHQKSEAELLADEFNKIK